MSDNYILCNVPIMNLGQVWLLSRVIDKKVLSRGGELQETGLTNCDEK